MCIFNFIPSFCIVPNWKPKCCILDKERKTSTLSTLKLNLVLYGNYNNYSLTCRVRTKKLSSLKIRYLFTFQYSSSIKVWDQPIAQVHICLFLYFCHDHTRHNILLIQLYFIVHSILPIKQLFEKETSPWSLSRIRTRNPAMTNKRKTSAFGNLKIFKSSHYTETWIEVS